MRTAGLDFREAVEELARQAGMEIPAPDPREQERAKRRDELSYWVEHACSYFERQLESNAGSAVRAYLRSRGFGLEEIVKWRIGFAPRDAQGLINALRAEGCSLASMLEAGLARTGDDGTYSFFRHRLIFPVMDRHGVVVGFGGRAVDEGQQPKYLNSPDAPHFHKGSLLYGYHFARALSAAEKRPPVLVEGYTDVIRLHMLGLPAVAPLGTACTEEQLRLLWRIHHEPVALFDGDPAGQRAARRLAEEVALPQLATGQGLRFSMLPAGHDPDSIGRDAPGALLEAIPHSIPLSEAVLGWNLPQEGASAEARAQADARLLELSKRVPEKGVASRLRQAWMAEAWRSRRQPRLVYQAPTDPSALALRRHEIALRILVDHPWLIGEVEEELVQLELPEPLQALRTGLIAGVGQNIRHVDVMQAFLRDGGPGLCEPLNKLYSEAMEAHRIPDGVSADEIRAAWRDMMAPLREASLEEDLQAAAERFANDPSPENWRRLVALQEAR
jgi:DNA primase